MVVNIFHSMTLDWGGSVAAILVKKNNNYVRQASGHHCMPRWLHVNVVINGSDFHIFNGRSMACKIAQYFRAVRNPIQKGGLVQGSNRMELRGWCCLTILDTFRHSILIFWTFLSKKLLPTVSVKNDMWYHFYKIKSPPFTKTVPKKANLEVNFQAVSCSACWIWQPPHRKQTNSNLYASLCNNALFTFWESCIIYLVLQIQAWQAWPISATGGSRSGFKWKRIPLKRPKWPKHCNSGHSMNIRSALTAMSTLRFQVAL